MSDDLSQVSVEQDGRVLTGIGADADSLTATMERHAPKDAAEPVVQTDGVTAPAEPRVSRGQKRFSELTSERDKAQHRAEQAERERDELRQKLTAPVVAEPNRSPAAAPATPTFETPSRTTEAAEPDFELDYEGQIGTKFQTWAAALTAYNRDFYAFQQKANDIDARIRASIEADRASRAAASLLEDINKRGRAVYTDFDAMLKSGPGLTIPLAPSPELWEGRRKFLINHPQSEHIQYAILKDAALATRLGQMNDVEFGIAASQLVPSAAGVSPASPAQRMDPPPPPYQPVQGNGSTTVPSSADLAQRGTDDYDSSGYRQKRAKERGVRA